MNRIDIQARPGLPFLFLRKVPAWVELYGMTGDTIRARLRATAEGPVALEFSSAAGTAVYEPVTGSIVLRCPGASTAVLSGAYLYDVELVSGTTETVMFGGTITFRAPDPAYVPVFAATSDLDRVTAAIVALSPRGRAWQTSPVPVADETNMRRFWRAMADAFWRAIDHLDALRAEMFAGSAVRLIDEWNREFGLPDDCDPFETFVAKAGALGDTTPAYAVAAAGLKGWSIAIQEEITAGAQVGQFGLARFGASFGPLQPGITWRVIIDSGNSPIAGYASPMFGRMSFGQFIACPADTSALVCVLRRIVPAHVDLVYQEI